jgi:ribose-phosphate pyrophosphokinase
MKNFSVITMPGGEPHVKYIGPPDIAIDTIRVTGIVTPQKLISAGLACEIADRLDASPPRLVLPYIPGGRQDRVDIPEVGFTLSTMTDIISRFHFRELVTLDPHSDMTGAMLGSKLGLMGKRLTVIPHEKWFLRWIEGTTFAPGLHKFLFPDKGAQTKYSKVASYSPNLSCYKIRHPETGKLSGFGIPDLSRWKDNFVWIVDDICDGGGTFLGIAQEIYRQYGRRHCYLGLAVSHGIFSQGIGDLSTAFDCIVTTDSVYSGQFGPYVNVQPLEGLYA